MPAPGVLVNDTDPDVGDTLSVYDVQSSTSNVGTATTTATGGTVTLNSDGSYTYIAPLSYVVIPIGQSAQDSFTYSVQDNHGAVSFFTTVTITVFGTFNCASVGDVRIEGTC